MKKHTRETVMFVLGWGLVFALLFSVAKYLDGSEKDEGVGTDDATLYETLMKDFDKIFPDRNRNSGGAQFYHHITETLQPSYKDFVSYNKFYCAVSGSPIDYQRTDARDDIVIQDIGGKLIHGTYYRCCSPCVCDITKYARVEQHEYRGTPIYVFVINDPCQSEDKIPSEVTSFNCKRGKTHNGSFTQSGRLIMGVLHDATPYDPRIHSKTTQNLSRLCQERHETPLEEIQSGMGDIFIRLANINPFR